MLIRYAGRHLLPHAEIHLLVCWKTVISMQEDTFKMHINKWKDWGRHQTGVNHSSTITNLPFQLSSSSI